MQSIEREVRELVPEDGHDREDSSAGNLGLREIDELRLCRSSPRVAERRRGRSMTPWDADARGRAPSTWGIWSERRRSAWLTRAQFEATQRWREAVLDENGRRIPAGMSTRTRARASQVARRQARQISLRRARGRSLSCGELRRGRQRHTVLERAITNGSRPVLRWQREGAIARHSREGDDLTERVVFFSRSPSPQTAISSFMVGSGAREQIRSRRRSRTRRSADAFRARSSPPVNAWIFS